MAIFLKTVQKSGFRPGVLHQPLAPGPRGSPESKKGGIWDPWPRAGDLGLPGTPRGPSGTPGRPGPSGTLPGNRGAPARGVDVKPPSRRSPGTPPGPRIPESGFRGLPQPPGRGTPGDPGPRPPGPESRETSRTGPGEPFWASQGPGAARAPPPGVVLHQPLAAGPRGSPGSRRGPPGLPPPGRSPPGLTAES